MTKSLFMSRFFKGILNNVTLLKGDLDIFTIKFTSYVTFFKGDSTFLFLLLTFVSFFKG